MGRDTLAYQPFERVTRSVSEADSWRCSRKNPGLADAFSCDSPFFNGLLGIVNNASANCNRDPLRLNESRGSKSMTSIPSEAFPAGFRWLPEIND